MPLFGDRNRDNEARQPLLPQYEDETSLQRQLHQKLHSYQMMRALSRGYMPSNEQTIICLRTLLASDVLRPTGYHLSDATLALAHYSKQLIQQLIDLLRHKNSKDQIQDFIWYLIHARVSVDTADAVRRLSKSRARADTAAGTLTCLNLCT